MNVDLVIFMGQSNMAGRGASAEAPLVPKGYGYEFRAVSDPSKLYDINEVGIDAAKNVVLHILGRIFFLNYKLMCITHINFSF